MYKEFYGLKDNPFTLTPDTEYLYPAKCSKEALDCLSSGISTNSGLIVLTGEIGSGKTLLLKSYVKGLSQNYRVIHVFYPTSSCIQLLQMILLNMGVKTIRNSRDALREELKNQLTKNTVANRQSLLVIDEAQNLDKDALSEVVRLTELNNNGESLLTVILVGLPDLQKNLSSLYSPEADNVSICHLENLPQEYVREYILYRLTTAGCHNLSLFPDAIIEEIGRFSSGTPRLINMICESLLIEGYASNQKKITAPLLKGVIDNMFYEMSPESKPHPDITNSASVRTERSRDIIEENRQPDKQENIPDLAGPLPLTAIVLERNARMKVHIENEFRKSGANYVVITSLEYLFAELDRTEIPELQVIIADVDFFFDGAGLEDSVGKSALDRIQTAYSHVPLIMTATLPLTSVRTKLFQRGVPILLKKPDLSRVDLSEVSDRLNSYFEELRDTLSNMHSQFDAFYQRVIKWGYKYE